MKAHYLGHVSESRYQRVSHRKTFVSNVASTTRGERENEIERIRQ